MTEDGVAAGVDDEGSGQLQDVADGLSDSKAPRHGCKALDRHRRRKRLQRRHPFQVKLAIERLSGVGDHWKGDLEFPEERPAFRGRAHPDQNHLGAGLFELVFPGAQLRHLLAAERSAEMAQKHQHQPSALPEIAEAHCRAVRHDNIRILGHRSLQ